MSTLISRMMPPLIYLNVAAYTAKSGHINDYSSTPRPHNCISYFMMRMQFFIPTAHLLRYAPEMLFSFPGNLSIFPSS